MPARRTLVLFAGLSLSSASLGQVVTTLLIASGQNAPFVTGNFGAPQNPACQAPGRVAFFSALSGTGNPGLDNRSVWQAQLGGGPSLFGIQGLSVPGAAGRTIFAIPGVHTQNRAGGVMFPARLDPPFSDDNTIMYHSGGLLRIAVREGDAAHGVPGAVFGEVGLGGLPLEHALNDSGRIAFLAPLTGVSAPGNRAIFTGDATTQLYTLVARQGEPSPTPGGAAFSFLTPPSINSAGDVSFFSNLSGAPNFALFLRPSGGALQPVISAGDPAPGFAPGWTITSLAGQNSGPPMMNDSAEFAISGGVFTSMGGISSAALWRGGAGALELVARLGDQAPGLPMGAQFITGFGSMINRGGDVLFYSSLSGVPQPAGFWIAPAGQSPRLLALLNAQAPDMAPGTLLTSISVGGYTINNRGEGLIYGSLNYAVNGTPATGIFAGRHGRLRKVVASGDMFEVNGVTRTVQSVACLTGNSPDSGHPMSINDRGEVAFTCAFVGGGGALFLAQLPHPCPGDTNGDDQIDFADLNTMLSQFGQTGVGLPGDANGDGVVDFADLNQILTVFGQSCQ